MLEDLPSPSPRFSTEYEPTDATKIAGYYDSKSRKKISNINEFINNMMKITVLSEFCKQDDQDFAGIRKCFV